MNHTVAIVGSSVGGVRTAQALRAAGHDGRIILIGAEAELPYDKPPLSKQFLAGTWDANRIALLTQEAADASGIELRLGLGATHLDVADHAVTLADGEQISYDTVVVATGASARPSPWPAQSGVHVLRTLSDSRALQHDLAGDGPLVIVGGGFIGAEVAASARGAGRAVTIIDPLPAPIGRLLGREVGTLIAQAHLQHGVATRFGVGVTAIHGDPHDLRVLLSDGDVIAAPTVVVGIGATPNVGWLESSGLLIDDGIVCDRYCRAVDSAHVFAVGDVARWFHPGHGEYVRVEHWTNAVEQAACVAHNITQPDLPRAYSPTEYVWSDQYDWKIQIVGRPQRCSTYELIGDPTAQPPRFAALYRDDRELGAAVTVNWAKALVSCRRLIAAHASFEDGLSLVQALITPAATT